MMYRSVSKYIFIAILFSAALQVKSQGRQSAVPVTEMVYVHTDREIYVAGEAIRYKAYLINLSGASTPCSRIIYFCLTGTGHDNMISWRINIDSSSVAGTLPIPEDTKPGMYVLTAYTNWMRNNPPSTWFSDRIIITSLKTENAPVLRFFRPQSSPVNNDTSDDVSLQLIPGASEIAAGENMELTLDLKSHDMSTADLSLSVTAVSPFDSLLADNDLKEAMYPAVLRTVNPRYFTECRHKVEDRGFVLSGRIISAPGTARSRCDVWLAVRDSVTPHILFAPVDTSGNFSFFLNRTYDNKELIIQLANPEMSADCRIEIFSKTALPYDTITVPFSASISESEFLASVNNIRLVEAVYGFKEQQAEKTVSRAGASYLNMPDRVVIPSEYADLRNFREIAGNIIPEVRFGTRRDEFFLEVLSPNITLWKDNHLVMLNGVPFTDLAYISTLGTKEIRRIEVIQPNVLIGRFTLPGLVSIYTYDGKIPDNYLRSRTVRYQNTVLPADQRKSGDNRLNEEMSSSYPDFRNCIYWKPFLKLSSGSNLKLVFPAGLLTGKFVIRAEGITGNGDPVSATGYYQVKEK